MKQVNSTLRTVLTVGKVDETEYAPGGKVEEGVLVVKEKSKKKM